MYRLITVLYRITQVLITLHYQLNTGIMYYQQSFFSDVFHLWHQHSKDEIEYFRLGDLWDCYDELSVYGFGSQVDLKNGEIVVHVSFIINQLYLWFDNKNVHGRFLDVQDDICVAGKIMKWFSLRVVTVGVIVRARCCCQDLRAMIQEKHGGVTFFEDFDPYGMLSIATRQT